MAQAMAFARSHGFTFSLRNAQYSDGGEGAGQRSESARAELPVHMIPELEPDREYPLMSVLSPVFDASGEVLFVLAVIGFARNQTGHEIEAIGRRLRQACDRISASVAGRRATAG